MGNSQQNRLLHTAKPTQKYQSIKLQLKSPNMGLPSIYENYRTINLKNILGRQPRIH